MDILTPLILLYELENTKPMPSLTNFAFFDLIQCMLTRIMETFLPTNQLVIGREQWIQVCSTSLKCLLKIFFDALPVACDVSNTKVIIRWSN